MDRFMMDVMLDRSRMFPSESREGADHGSWSCHGTDGEWCDWWVVGGDVMWAGVRWSIK